MKAYILTFILCCISFFCTAQQHDYNWMFGSFTYPDEPNRNGNIINFSGDTVSIEVYEKEIAMSFYNGSYSNAEGEFKFWTNGCELYGADNEILENGDTLNAGYEYDIFCDNQTGPSGVTYTGARRAMMSLPDLSDEQRVYVFHKWNPVDLGTEFHRLYYSVVDFTEDEAGVVMEKNIELEGNTSTGLIAATKNASYDAWWVVTAEKWGTGHYTYKLEGDSVSSPTYFGEGAELTSNNQAESSSAFSPDGSRYAIIGEADGLRIYDFDNATGSLSNYRFFEAPQDVTGGSVGLSFSASGRYLYVSHRIHIYQYDMEASDIGASRLTVADFDGHVQEDFGFFTQFFQMERGPDCRIYLSAQNGVNTMHVIHHPDRRGVACEVQQNVELPAFNFLSLPAFPNYRLGTGPVCDSTKVFPPGLLTAVEEASMATAQEGLHVHLYPNPTRGDLSLDIDQRLGQDADFVLYNLQGQEQYRQALSGDIGTTQISLPSRLSAGMYIYGVYDGGRLMHSDKVVIE